MKHLLKYTLAVGFGLLALTACLKKKPFSPIPQIDFKSFVKYSSDSADFTCTFQDGDGDIGLQQKDTSGSYCKTCPYYYNMVLTYYYKKTDGIFSKYTYIGAASTSTMTVIDTLGFKYRIPDITPVGQNKAINGEIRVTIKPAPYYVDTHIMKVFRYEAYIYDRALNKSNVIVSPDIPIP